MTTATCPRCGHRPGPADPDTHPGVCPACGIAYAKWLARQAASEPEADRAETLDTASGYEGSLGERLREQLLLPPDGSDPDRTGLRELLLAALAIWTLWFASGGIDWEAIGGSFLHSVDLAFHEFGHLFFMPFGRTMTILGGSLFQFLLPVSLALYFAAWQQDNFAAAVASWWAGQNLVDLSPYIRDAEYRGLPLVGGNGEQSHDWGNLLTQWEAVDSCYALARASFWLGILMMAAALAWGAMLLWRVRSPR